MTTALPPGLSASGSFSEFLEKLPEALKPGGRAVVISYHSLEDRIVKQKFKEMGQRGALEILTKKVVCASPEEQRNNPRSRSAKLRCAQKI
jgi:16S rRNA (cytosine1402-N4)-methyltransferase